MEETQLRRSVIIASGFESPSKTKLKKKTLEHSKGFAARGLNALYRLPAKRLRYHSINHESQVNMIIGQVD